jgi:arylsulfatase B
MLSAADEGILNVTQALKGANLWNNTLVLFTTDNGGPTETCAVQGSSNYPKRGGKCSCWEGGTTGDGFVSGPALETLGIAPGKLDSLFHVVDWLPTLASIVGATPSGKLLDGVNQWSTLQRQAKSARRELFIGYGIDLMKIWSGPAIRYQKWKLLEVGYRGPPDRHHNTTATFHLYNIEDDPSEQNDLAPSRPFLVAWLRGKLDQYKTTLTPLPEEDPSCPWHLTNITSFGPTWIPWCDRASRVVVYE